MLGLQYDCFQTMPRLAELLLDKVNTQKTDVTADQL